MNLKPEVIRMLFRLARLDGEVDPAESELLGFLVESYGLEDLRAELEKESDETFSLSDLAGALEGEAERAQAYELACLMSLMDSREQFEESAFLSRLATGLGLGEEAKRKAKERAEAIYERYRRR